MSLKARHSKPCIFGKTAEESGSQNTCQIQESERHAPRTGAITIQKTSHRMNRILTTRLLTAIAASACCTGMRAQKGTDGKGSNAFGDKTLQEVVVTATGTGHLLKDVPVQTEVISRKMIESYGGKSIEDILGGLTASFSFNEGDMGSQTQLNGLGNSYILILIDGKRIHGDNGGENDLSLIDPHNIERIEVVKGAQSALYGSDAIAGVINIITKKHDTEGLLFENSTRYGRFNDLRQHNGVGFRIGKVQSYTGFQLQHTDGWQNTAEEYAEGKVLADSRNKTLNKFTNWQISEKLTYTPTKDLELYADGTFYRKIINRPTNGKYASCDVYTYDLLYRNMSASLGGKYFTNRRKKDYVSVDADWNRHAYYYQYTARTYEDAYIDGELEHGVPFYAGQQRLQSDQQRLMVTAKGVFHLPYSNTLNAGAEYRHDYLKAPMRTAKGSAGDNTASVYVQDEYNPLAWLNITAGARLVDNGKYGLHFTPKVSVMASAGDFRLRIGWSQGFKSPTVKELYYRYLHVMGSTTFFNMGNTDLKPQTSNYLSANAEYRTEKFTASVTGYLNKLDNMIALVNVPVDMLPKDVTTNYFGDGSDKVTARMYQNMENAKTYGVDVNLSYNICKDLTLSGNYSYLDTKAHQYNTDRSRLEEVTIDGMAHHKWNVSAIYSHRFSGVYRLGANISTRGSSKRYYENNGNGKGFQIWRINTTHDFGNAKAPVSYKVELGVDNIFNYRDTTMHPYHLGTTTGGATWYVGFAVKFNKGKRINNHSTNKKNKNDNEED